EILNNSNQASGAAKLIGTADALFKSMGLELQRIEQQQIEQIVKKLHEKLSEEEYSKHFEEGNGLTLEQAIKIALYNE
ncbi:MAG: hypothetical protein ABI550_06140, partial [Ignavibacteriaceae bacterium]